MLADKHRADFLLDFENHTFCNHGSYGAAPKVCTVMGFWSTKYLIFRWYATEKMNYWWKWKVIPIRGSGRFFIKWDASSRWSRSLCCLMCNSDEMTIGKKQPTLLIWLDFPIGQNDKSLTWKLVLERQHYRVTLTAARLLLILSTLHMRISQLLEIQPRKKL